MKDVFVSRPSFIPSVSALSSTTVYYPELAHLLSRGFPRIVLTTKGTVEKSDTLIDVAQLREWAGDRKCGVFKSDNSL